jgi:hypothetical protein
VLVVSGNVKQEVDNCGLDRLKNLYEKKRDDRQPSQDEIASLGFK